MARFETELDPRKLERIFRTFSRAVPWSAWRKRVGELRAELPGNYGWQQYLLDRHGLEIALADINRYRKATHRWPWPPRTADEARLASFIATFSRVYDALSPPAKRRLAGAVKSAFEKDIGLGPIAHEMRVVAHLMNRGFDLEFNDLENGGGFDFLARAAGIELEVECKHVSADVGRQIHRRKLYYLGSALYTPMLRSLDESNTGRLVRIRLPGRLTGEKGQQAEIVASVTRWLQGNRDTGGACSIDAVNFDLSRTPFAAEASRNLSWEKVRTFIHAAFGLDETHALVAWLPQKSALIAYFESEEPDVVLERLFKRLKDDAKRQLSGRRPAFMFIHLADLTQAQLLDLAKAETGGGTTGIQRALDTLLRRRVHLCGVALMANGEVRLAGRGRRDRSVQESGLARLYSNPEHPLANEPALRRVFEGVP